MSPGRLAAMENLNHALDAFFAICPPVGLNRSGADTSIDDFDDFLHSQSNLATIVYQKLTRSRALLLKVAGGPLGNKLPPEILARIFAFYVSPLPHDFKSYKEPNPHRTDAIALVCSSWRWVAMTVPSLWSQILIDGRQYHNPQRTKLWLVRSHGVPIHLHVRNIHDNNQVHQIADVLRPHLSRIVGLSFYQSNCNLINSLQLPSDQTNPKTLSFFVAQTVEVKLGLRTLRGLQGLELSNVADYLVFEDLTTVLSNSPTLQSLRVRNLSFHSNESIHTSICLPMLRQLEMAFLENSTLQAISSLLYPGTLGLEIVLAVSHGCSQGTASSIQALLQRSNVVALDVSNFSLTLPVQLVSYLNCTPGVRTLTLDFGPKEISFDSPFISTRLPELRALSIATGVADSVSLQNKIVKLAEMCNLNKIVFDRRVEFGWAKDAPGADDWIRDLRKQVKDVVFGADVRDS